MGFHGFSRNQKIVTDGFPWSLDTEPKYCFLWDLKYVLPENIHTPPPHPPQKTLWCAPPRPGFSIPGGLSWPPPPRRFETGTSLNTLWKWTPPPLRFPMIIHWGEVGVWIFYVILRLPCTCQWTVDSIGKSGFCSKSQNPKVDFNNVFKVDFK